MLNVTQIRPPGHLHAHALDDAARYLAHMLAACGREVRLTVNQLATDATNVVVGGHLLGPAELPPGTIVFNSEPVAEHGRWPGYAALLARAIAWDYSPVNGTGAVVPFLYCAAMAQPVRPPGSALDPSALPFGSASRAARSALDPSALPFGSASRAARSALLFYGALTPRRVAILDGLRAAGVPVEVAFGTYGADRDARLARAGAVLNLHKTDDARTFEPIRCFYPLHRGLPVISEATTDPAADDFRDSVAFVPVDDIAAAFAARDPARAARFARTSALARIAELAQLVA